MEVNKKLLLFLIKRSIVNNACFYFVINYIYNVELIIPFGKGPSVGDGSQGVSRLGECPSMEFPQSPTVDTLPSELSGGDGTSPAAGASSEFFRLTT